MSELDVLWLRLEAPLMSFGGVRVDERGPTAAFPGRSMVAGLLANALGYRHGEHERLQRLQERLRYAVRRDRRGRLVQDYQTVDLGQDFLREGWTTRGAPEGRAGGSAKTGTHIRYREYWADAVFTVALTLDPADEEPALDDCARALQEPERPLFLGRKPCLPSSELFLDTGRVGSLVDALRRIALHRRAEDDDAFAVWWPEEGEPRPEPGQGRLVPVTDERDWQNQIHVGRRFVWEGRLLRTEVNGSEVNGGD